MYRQLGKTVIAAWLVLSGVSAHAQTWQWASRSGGSGSALANAVETDPSGNSYLTGTFFDSASFGAVSLVRHGQWSVFLAKYDANGQVAWAKIIGVDSAIFVSSLCRDPEGNLFIAGRFFGSATFETMPQDTLASSGDFDVFIARCDSTGSVRWVTSLGGPGIDYAGGASTDGSGNVYITGDLHISSFPFSGSKIFLARYDTAGNNTWMHAEVNVGTDHFGNGIKTDSTGNSYITGEFFNTLHFSSSDSLVSGNVESNFFLAKFDAMGNWLWGRQGGAPSGYCGSKTIDVDAAGNSFISGYFHGTIAVGPFSLSGTSGLANEVFVVRCDTGGNFTWATASSGPGLPRRISLDPSGNVWVCGTFQQPISFGPLSFVPVGSNDIFVVRADASGNFNWGEFCGSANNDFAAGLKTTLNGIWVAGNFTDTIHFGPLLSLAPANGVSANMFMARLNLPTGIEEESRSVVTSYPNPAHNEIRFINLQGNVRYRIYDERGALALSGILGETHSIAVSSLTEGLYFVQLLFPGLPGVSKSYRFIKD